MQDPLYERLRGFRFGDDVAHATFVRRLAHENGWTHELARQVVGEYRKFLWLAVRAGHPVTPPPAVDECWHLHLCHTRSYLVELCGRVLGTVLHHDPTRGGAGEHAKFTAWYARTLASYRAHFGEPPATVWPGVDVRMDAAIPRKVDVRAHWIVSRAAVRRAAGAAAAVVATGTLAACGRSWPDDGVVSLVVVLGIAALWFGWLVRTLRRDATRPRTARRADPRQHERGGAGAAGSTGAACGHGRHGDTVGDAGDGSASGCGADGGGGGSGCGSGGCGGGGD